MSQLYEVAFSAHYPHHVDSGRVLVCAPNQDAALDIINQELGLPQSSTQALVTRIRPALYIVDRRELNKQQKESKKPKPQPTGLTKFIVTIEASIIARNEEHALKRLQEALKDKIAGQEKTRYLKIEVVPLIETANRMHAMEQIETYRPKTFIGGIRK